MILHSYTRIAARTLRVDLALRVADCVVQLIPGV
jgi:hypothetical protein